jgi:preprotein translocase subunit SecF
MGYVTEAEISQALDHQSTLQTVRQELSNAVRNPVQHKLLWFIVVFALIGIITIYSIVTGTVDENIGANTNTNIAQNEDINANTVKQKKLRLRYIGHNSRLKEMEDTTLKIKNRANLFKKNTNSQIKGIESDLVYSQQMMNEQDSINSSEIGDLEDIFFSFQSVQKLKNKNLDGKDEDFLTRLNELEKKINELESRLPKEDK